VTCDFLIKIDESNSGDCNVAVKNTLDLSLPENSLARKYIVDNKDIIVFGEPIINEKINDEKLLTEYIKADSIKKFARNINGTFLLVIYDKLEKKMTVINDRFASYPFYYYEFGQSSIVCSNKFRQLLKYKNGNASCVNGNSIFEFIYFRKLLGNKTFDNGIYYLDSASILEVKNVGLNIDKYWIPDYSRQERNDSELIDKLSMALKKSVDSYTSDDENCALLLSGGIDSRTILAASRNNISLCATTAQSKNNEYYVAHEIASYCNKKHAFIKRQDDIFEESIFDAIDITGGMQVYNECQFLNHKKYFSDNINTFLTGFGLDILLTDLYLPVKQRSIFNLPVMHNKIFPLQNDISKEFLQKSKYRLKTSDPFSIIKDDKKSTMYDYLYSEVDKIIKKGEEIGAEGYKLWEYLSIHNLSRHYSYPMIMSIRTFARCRNPALDNDLFDLSIAMGYKQKLNSGIYKKAIYKLDPELMNIRNANTNMKASLTARQQTYIKYMYYVLDKLGVRNIPRNPGWKDRTWGLPCHVIAASSRIKNLINKLATSERLMDLDYLDMNKVSNIISEHNAQKHDHAVLINHLLTIDEGLKV
jgi:asparagine synthase (glutamine-hydrolysing)